MPNPVRLHQLTELREAAGLTLSDMAECCGLSGSQSRKTVALWEQGQSTPRRSNRAPFLRYLWHDLRLRDDPPRFEEIWAILVEEWAWEPLAEEDHALLAEKVEGDRLAIAVEHPANGAPPGNGSALPSVLVQAPPVESNSTTEADQREVDVLEQAHGRRRWPLSATLIAVALILGLSVAAIQVFRAWSRVDLPDDFSNLSFENETVAPWTTLPGENCQTEVVTDPLAAADGQRYTRLTRIDETCNSFFQDQRIDPASKQTHHFGIWVRASSSVPVTGTLVFWVGVHPLEINGVVEEERVAREFEVDNQSWQCVQIALDLEEQEVDTLRAAIHMGSPAGAVYEFDHATFQTGADARICPEDDAGEEGALYDGGFEEDEQLTHWEWTQTEPCKFVVRHDSQHAHDGKRYLHVTRDKCKSMYQLIRSEPRVDDVYHVALWARSPTLDPTQFILTLKATGINEDKSYQLFTTADNEWRCFEVALEIEDQGHTHLVPEILFEASDGIEYEFDDVQLALGDRRLCPDYEVRLANGGFEEGENLNPWQFVGDCNQRLAGVEEVRPRAGDRVLAIERGTADCGAFYQEVYTEVEKNETYRGAVWIRSSDGTRKHGTLLVVAPGETREASEQRYIVDSDEWTCFETALTVGDPGHNLLRFEIHADDAAGEVVYFDDARLYQGHSRSCPQSNLGIRSSRIVQPAGTYYPGATIGVEVEVKNFGVESVVEESQIQFWVARHRDGDPVDHTFVATAPLPPLAPGASTMTLYQDVGIPTHIEPGETYYLVFDLNQVDNVPSTDEVLRRDSRAFMLLFCSEGTLFCDIPADHWARTEIEAWHNAGITTGCKSGTTPYKDRPFCPYQRIERVVLPIFLLRQIHGAGYQPTREFEGAFADVPEAIEHAWALWIEDLYAQGLSLDHPECVQGEDRPKFCPDLTVTRLDLVRYLTEIQGWKLPDSGEPIFADVPADSFEGRILTYMQDQGFLPQIDPLCPDRGDGRRFCPDAPLYRVDGAVIMARVFDLVDSSESAAGQD